MFGIVSKRALYQTSSAIAVLSGMLISLPGGISPALGQQITLDEIVVTARRREENLMQVPLAITAVTGVEIGAAGMRDLIDLGKFTPGLFASVGGNGRTDRSNTRLTFRGLSVANGQKFIDGAPFGSSQTPDLSDVERVEVLKGPQSVYFGRATYSGAVNYVSREPSDTFEGRAAADISTYGGSDITFSVEGPVVADKLNMRFGVIRHYAGGQYENPLQGDRLGQEETNGFNIYATYKPSDSLKVKAFYTYNLDEDGPPTEAVLLARKTVLGANGVMTTTPTGGELQCNLGGTAGPYWCGQLKKTKEYIKNEPYFISVDTTIDALVRTRLFDNIPQPVAQAGNAVLSYPYTINTHWLQHLGIKRETHDAHLNLDYETASGWGIVATTAWDRTKQASLNDQLYRDMSLLPNPFYISPAATPLRPRNVKHVLLTASYSWEVSQELRVTSPLDEPFRYVFGGNYYKFKQPGVGLQGMSVLGAVQNNYLISSVKTPAVFAGAYYDITDQLTLSAEGRYQWDGIAQQQAFPILTQRLHSVFKSFSPRVTLDYQITDTSLLYALYSKGYEPGGFNTALIGNVQSVIDQLKSAGALLAFKQETLQNFEIGYKTTWLDGRAQTTFAAYTDKWRDGKVLSNIFLTLPGGGFGQQSVTVNGGSVNLKGIEAEGRVAITEDFEISASLAYQDNKIIQYELIPTGPRINGKSNVAGNSLEQAPKWTWSLSPQYGGHLAGDWNWFSRLDYTHRGKYFITNVNVAQVAPLDLLNFRLGISDEVMKLEAYVRNLTQNDEIPEAVGNQCCSDIILLNTGASAIRVGVPDKRTFGIKGSYQF